MQYHFLDECGDPGLKIGEGSSSHFVMAMIQLAQRDQSELLHQLRSQLHLPNSFEFKFHNTTDVQRRVFFKAIESLSYRIRIVVIDKSNFGLAGTGLSGNPLMIEYIAQLALRASELDLTNDVLIVDGAVKSFTRKLRVRLTEECRVRNRTRPFKKIIGADSRREPGLQFADMVAGAAMRLVRDRDDLYYNLFVESVVDLWKVFEDKK